MENVCNLERFIEGCNNTNGKVALVVGGSGGIGLPCVDMLLSTGYSVIIVSKDVNKKIDFPFLLNKVDRAGIFVCRVFLDLLCTEQVSDFVEDIKGLISIDLIIYAAGVTSCLTSNLAFDDINGVFQINAGSLMYLNDRLLPLLLNSSRPYIINISSRSAKIGFADKGLYGSSKAAFAHYLNSVRAMYQNRGLRVVSICPSWVDTPMARQGGCNLEGVQMIQPDDIVNTITWILGLSRSVIVEDVVMGLG